MGFLEQLGVKGVEGGLNFSFVKDIGLLLILLIIAGVFTYVYIHRKSYNKTIVKYREINGIVRRVGSEKAREIVLPNTSVRACYLRNSKFFIPRPSIETGQNEYWYFIRDDGEWLNIGMANVNRKLKELDLKFDHTDMRMANAALKRLVDKSYKKSNWIKEWAPYIGFSVIIIMLAIGGYLVMGESGKVAGAAARNVESLNEIVKSLDTILGNMNNIASSSGVRSAG